MVTSVHANKRYFGPLHAAVAITAEEGGGTGAMYNMQHLGPTLLVHGIRAALRFATTRFITDELGLNPDFYPMLHKLAFLSIMALEVAIVTPIEVARKRIQVQKLKANLRVPGESYQPFRASVEMAPKYYNGLWSAIYGIISEEGPLRKRRKRGTKSRSWNRGHADAANPPSVGDWQDLYDLPAEAAPRRVKKSGFQKLGKFWQGVASLYRGFWARYAVEVVRFAFHEIRDSEEWLV
ncbi:hypothetical protein HDU96_010564 [Phlyctochytrium bullatum]|nr:hypothetical protein HDU96_010564 [Phlyctochytrium bullatum]